MNVRTLPIGASAARIFAGFGPRIALEAPDMAGLARQFETHSSEVKSLLSSAGDKLKRADERAGELDARLAEIEQKMSRPGGAPSGSETKTAGERFIESDQLKAFLGTSTRRGVVRVEMEGKALLSSSATWGTGASPSNSLVIADRRPLVALPQRPLVIRDLLTVTPTTSNAIEYPVQTGFTNAAAPVAENTKKPESSIAFDLKSTPVRTIAHLMKASRQIMDDVPMLRSFIDNQMTYGLHMVEEAQILYGDGTGQNLLGIVPQATLFSAPFAVTGETIIDRFALAIAQAEVALVPATGIVINPIDWARVRLIKDGMGRYLIGDPQNEPVRRLWEMPVAVSMAITAGTFLIGAFRNAAEMFERLAVEVLISTENTDDFEKNMITVRVEERVAMAVYRPQGFVTGSLPS